jgi:F0F1-type ATP synthase assembly protein I
MTKPRDPDQPAPWVSSLSVASLGIEMGVFALGMGIGYLLDKQFHTAPILLFVGVGFGIVTAFVTLFRTAKKIHQESKTGDKDSK